MAENVGTLPALTPESCDENSEKTEEKKFNLCKENVKCYERNILESGEFDVVFICSSILIIY